MTEDGKNRGQGREDHFLARMTGMDTVTACHFSRNRVLDFLRAAVLDVLYQFSLLKETLKGLFTAETP